MRHSLPSSKHLARGLVLVLALAWLPSCAAKVSTRSFEVTAAMRLMPPRMIIASTTARMPPVRAGWMPKAVFIEFAMLLICGMLPVPNEQMIVASANSTAIHFMFRRFFM